jgi:hypothetical protein
MIPHKTPQSLSKEMNQATSLKLFYFWLALGLYILSFIAFVSYDLYAEHTTQGLFNTHRTPFLHAYGNVIDPKPKQSLNDEISYRVHVESSALPLDWFSELNTHSAFSVSHVIRHPTHDELLVGRTQDNNTLLVLGEYRGEWVTFRPSVGVLLEPNDPLIGMTSGIILRVNTP